MDSLQALKDLLALRTCLMRLPSIKWQLFTSNRG